MPIIKGAEDRLCNLSWNSGKVRLDISCGSSADDPLEISSLISFLQEETLKMTFFFKFKSKVS